MFPIQKVEMRFKNLLARKPILGSSFLNTKGEICSYVTAGRSVKFWTNLMSAQHHQNLDHNSNRLSTRLQC